MRINSPIIFLLAISLFGCNETIVKTPAIAFFKTTWAMDTLWDDGQAEVAAYSAERVVYGESRSFDYTYILVKETFNEEYQVKTDDYTRNDLYDVMKINKFCRIPTLAYPYHYLTSLFIERDNPSALTKLTNTSQEWCGNTAKSFLNENTQYLFEYMSYWDDEGNGEATISVGPLFEDQLSYTLRTLDFEDGLSFEVNLYPSQVNSRAQIPKAENATITITNSDSTNVNAFSQSLSEKIWKVTVDRTEGVDLTFWFADSYPNYLLKMEATDGRSLDLKALDRNAYWAME